MSKDERFATDTTPSRDARWSVETIRDMDVPKGAWDWIDALASAADGPHLRIETPRDAEAIVFWHNERPVAFVLNIRDQFNHSVQFRASLTPPSRDEEGSVDREAVARIIAPSMWESEAESALITFGRVVSLRKADAILALKTSTPETQTVEGGEQ